MRTTLKYLTILALFLPLSAFAFDNNLYYGLKGNSEVQELQEFLTDQGLYSGPITGNFFALTLKAVKAFQKQEGILTSGYFGSLSRGKANDILASQGVGTTITDESGASTTPLIVTAPATTNDVVTELKKQNQELQETLEAIKQNQLTANPTSPPSVPVPQPTPDKSDILIATRFGNVPENKMQYGEYQFIVSVLNKDGKYSHDAIVNIQLPDDDQCIVILGTHCSSPAPRKIDTFANPPSDEASIGFRYIPTTTGLKVITFSSGNLTKSVTIDVK